MIVALGLFPSEVLAFSFQIRGAGGGLLGEGGSYYYQGGLEAFLYEGRNLELFVGGEYTHEEITTHDFNLDFSVDILASTIGLRIKPTVSGRWKPYLSLGGIAGRVQYNATATGNSVLLSTSKGSASFGTYRAGLGVDIGIGTRYSLGIEANYTGNIPAFKGVVQDPSTGIAQEVTLNENNNMIGLNLMLRYYF